MINVWKKFIIKAHNKEMLTASIVPKQNRLIRTATIITPVDNTPEKNRKCVTPADWNIEPEVDNMI